MTNLSHRRRVLTQRKAVESHEMTSHAVVRSKSILTQSPQGKHSFKEIATLNVTCSDKVETSIGDFPTTNV